MEYIDGKAVLEKYSISVGELVKAILEGLPAYDAVTGKRVIDQDAMIAIPKYQTEEQAAKAVDYVDNMFAVARMRQGMPPFGGCSQLGASYMDGIVRRNKIQLFLSECKSYKFPDGYDRPQEPCGVFPLRYDTFHREYANAVHFKMHGDNETVIGLYQKLIGAMRLPVEAVEERFRKASSGSGFDIRHVALTPGQDWLGNPKPKRLERPTSLYDLLCRMEQAEPENRHILSLDITGEFKAGRLNIYTPPQDGHRLRYSPVVQSRATEIETLFAAAHYGGWTDVADLSALFVDMAEVEANETLNNALRPLASDNSGQEPEQVAPLGGVESAEALIAKLRAEGTKDKKELAAKVDEHFPGLSDAKLGELLPANPGTIVTWEAKNSQGRRLRGKK